MQIAVDSKSQTNDLQYSDYNHSDSHSLSYYSLIIKKKAGHHKLKILIVMFCDLDFCKHIHSGSHVLLGPFGPTLTGLIDILTEFAADYMSGKLVKHVSTLPSLIYQGIYYQYFYYKHLLLIWHNLPRIMSQAN